MAKQVIVEITGAGPQGPPGEKGTTGETGAEGPQGEKGLTGVNGAGVLLYESYNEAREVPTSTNAEAPALLPVPDAITFTVPEGGRTVSVQFMLKGKGSSKVSDEFAGAALFVDGEWKPLELGLTEGISRNLVGASKAWIFSSNKSGSEHTDTIATTEEGETTPLVGDTVSFFLPGGTHTIELRFYGEDPAQAWFEQRRLIVTMPGPVSTTAGYVQSLNEGEEEGNPSKLETLPAPDQITFTLTKDTMVDLYAALATNIPEGEPEGELTMFVDGEQLQASIGTGGTFNATPGFLESIVLDCGGNANLFTNHETPRVPVSGCVLPLFLKAGEHTIELRMKSGVWRERLLAVRF